MFWEHIWLMKSRPPWIKSVLKLAFNTDATLFCLFFTKAAAIHFKLKQYENKMVFSLLVVFCKACQQHEMSTNKKNQIWRRRKIAVPTPMLKYLGLHVDNTSTKKKTMLTFFIKSQTHFQEIWHYSDKIYNFLTILVKIVFHCNS